MTSAAIRETNEDLALSAAALALKTMTPEQLAKLSKAAAEVKAAKEEAVKLRKQLELRNAQAASLAEAPVVDRKAFFEELTKWLDFNFPGNEFLYERSYISQKLANIVTYLGRNKKNRKAAALKRRNRAKDVDLEGAAQEFGIEIPTVEVNRTEEDLSTINESLVRCKALQIAAIVYYENISQSRWEEPPEMTNNFNNRQGRREQSPDARSFHPREDDVAF